MDTIWTDLKLVINKSSDKSYLVHSAHAGLASSQSSDCREVSQAHAGSTQASQMTNLRLVQHTWASFKLV